MRTSALTENPPPCSHAAMIRASSGDSTAPLDRPQQPPAHGGLDFSDCRCIQSVGWVKGYTSLRIGIKTPSQTMQ